MKQQVKGLYAIVTSDKVSIMWLNEETNESATQNIYLRKYDELTKSYIDDQDSYASAMEQLNRLGTSLETVVDDAINLQAELYIRGTVASFKKLGTFFERTDAKLGKRLAKKPIIAPLKVVNEYQNVRLNLGVEIDGKMYRVSTLIDVKDNDEPDRKISLKYTNKQIDNQMNMIESGKLDPAVEDRVRSVVNDALAAARKNKIDELNEVFGFDVEKMLAGDVGDVNLEVRAEYADGFGMYYLVAEVVK